MTLQLRVKYLIFALATFSLASLTSCSKQIEQLDSEMPSLRLMSPSPETTYSQGDTIKLLFDVRDNLALRDVHVILESDDMELIHIHDFTDSQSHTIEASYVVDFAYPAKLHLGIKAMDQLANYITEEINLVVNPHHSGQELEPTAGK